MRQGYDKRRRGGSGRRGGGSWQWMLIGFLPGLLCGGLVIGILLVFDVVGNLGILEEPTPIVQTELVPVNVVVTTTPQAPQVITATPEPTSVEPTQASAIIVPTATPTTDPAEQTTAPDQPQQAQATATTRVLTTPVPTQASVAQQPNAAPQSTVPDALAPLVSQMVTIPGGVFEKGTTNAEIVEAARQCQERDGGQCPASDGTDSTPIVRVDLPDYQIEVTEVSFAQYVAYLNWLSSQGQRHTNACSGFICIQTTNENPTTGVITFDSANYRVPETLLNYPVYGVTWYGAESYCRAIGRRLPTEAEWENAARTPQGFIYPWGNEWDSNARANVRLPLVETTAGAGPLPIGSFPTGTNIYNLQDMAGNVAEWVSDYYDTNYYSFLANQAQPVLDPQGPVTGTRRVIRGGSYNTLPFYARAVHRQLFFPAPDSPNGNYINWVGFRCAADAGVQAGASANTGVTIPSDDGTGVATTPQNTLPTIAPAPEEGGADEGGSRG
jgi:formylglycine-generating enzyme required for sulfatase activity